MQNMEYLQGVVFILLGIASFEGLVRLAHGQDTATDGLCQNTTELTLFELDYNMTEADIDSLPYADAFEWLLRYVDESNNTMIQVEYKWAADYFVDEETRKVSLSKLNTTEVVCLPASQCVEFTIVGLRMDQFTARLNGTPIPTSAYDEREFYYFGQNTSSPSFTTEIGENDEGNVCVPVCDANKNEELLEMVVWGNDAGYSLDWLLMVDQEMQPVSKCPKIGNTIDRQECAYRNNYVYFVRRCLDKTRSYRLVLFNEFANLKQADPQRDHPRIDVKFGGEQLGSFEMFKTESVVFGGGTDIQCDGGQLFELFAHSTLLDVFDHYPSTAYQLSPKNQNQTVLLSGAVEGTDRLHYAWKCVEPTTCMTFSMNRDLEADYPVDVFILVDGVVYRDSTERWHDPEGPFDLEHLEAVKYPLIGSGCGSDVCRDGEVFMEMKFDDIQSRHLSTTWDVSLFTDEGKRYRDTLVEGSRVFDRALLLHRTYRHHKCLPNDQCYKLRVSGFLDSDDRGTNSSLRVAVEGEENVARRFPIIDDQYYEPPTFAITAPCSEKGLSPGKIAGAVTGSVVGFVGIVVVVFIFWRRRGHSGTSSGETGSGNIGESPGNAMVA